MGGRHNQQREHKRVGSEGKPTGIPRSDLHHVSSATASALLSPRRSR